MNLSEVIMMLIACIPSAIVGFGGWLFYVPTATA